MDGKAEACAQVHGQAGSGDKIKRRAWAHRRIQPGSGSGTAGSEEGERSKKRLTSPPLVNAVEADGLAFLRQADQGQQHTEFVAAEGERVDAAGSDDAHDASVVVSAELGGG